MRPSLLLLSVIRHKWEFNLVESQEVNAWAMPGGKVVVYEGILPIAKDELKKVKENVGLWKC